MPVRAIDTDYRRKFRIDLKRGNGFEDFVEQCLQERGWKTSRCNGPAYDIRATKLDVEKRQLREALIECKYDEKSDVTGNYCLEFDSLSHTQASLLVIGTKELAYMLSIEEARKLFNEYPKKQTGDFDWNYSAIVPCEVFNLNQYERL